MLTIFIYIIVAILLSKIFFTYDILDNKNKGYHNWKDTNPILLAIFWPISLPLLI